MHNSLAHLGAGQHAAFFYRSRQEQFSITIPFIKEGLERGERCLYVADDNSVAIVLRAMEEGGIDAEKAQAKGALRIATKYGTFVHDGIFNPVRMVEDLRRESELSMRLGFSGFRGTGEMTWVFTTPGACALLHDYETALDKDFPVQFAGLCQYNENCFSPEMISSLIRAHPVIVARGQVMWNEFYEPDATPVSPGATLLNINQVLLRASHEG